MSYSDAYIELIYKNSYGVPTDYRRPVGRVGGGACPACLEVVWVIVKI